MRLCAAWQEAGAEVAIVLGRIDGPIPVEASGCTVLVPPSLRLPTASFETAWMIANLPAMIRQWRPDVVFCPGNSYTVVAVAMKLLLGRACPPIVAKISNDLLRRDLPAPIRFFYRIWCRIQARFLDHLGSLSPAMRDEIVTVMRIDPASVSVIANPVLDRRRRAALAGAGELARQTRRGGRRFLAAGRLEPQKDFASLIRAFGRGANASDRLVIIGEGGQRQRLQRLIDTLALGDRVSLAGQSEQIERWMARSDVLVLSSRYEGLPGVVVEAMAAGLGIVATDCCASIAGLLGHGRFGTLVAPRLPAALADAIAGARSGQADVPGAADAAALFDAGLAAAAYLTLFQRLANMPGVTRKSYPPIYKPTAKTSQPTEHHNSASIHACDRRISAGRRPGRSGLVPRDLVEPNTILAAGDRPGDLYRDARRRDDADAFARSPSDLVAAADLAGLLAGDGGRLSGATSQRMDDLPSAVAPAGARDRAAAAQADLERDRAGL